ncbi:MAG: sulfurtransferase TusA family protein [Deltaproteobacteria bacterium]|nr:sulfurtransferase TusA family protein [Deltaproteobacteria bacterium]
MSEIKPDASMDLRGVLCPMNFVKAKLKLEGMEAGQVLEVVLDSGEPIQNVPKSIKEEGHRIVEVKREGDHFRLKIEKGA